MTKETFLTAIVCCLFAALVFIAQPANAQSFSSKGISQNFENANIKQCADGAMRAQERVLTLQSRVNTILNCNRQGQVYDRNARTCIDPGLSPDHVFRTRASGDTLAMINPNGTEGTQAVLGGRNGTSVTCMEDPVGCTFAGNALDHGDTVTAYRVATLPPGDSCTTATNRQTRTCNNGTLSGSFTHENCVVTPPDPPKNCTAPWGTNVNHGSSITAYETQVVPSSGTCRSQSRTCDDGTLSGTYQYQDCEADLPVTPEPPTGNCFFYVSGITPPYASIGQNDGFSDHVGKGAYPDATIPFAKANAGTFDFIAIGPKTRLVIYKQKNFKGGTFIDVQGPKVIGNECLPHGTYSRGWKTSDIMISGGGLGGNLDVLKANSTVYQNMFPPSTRIERVMNHTSVGCIDQIGSADPAAADKGLLWGGGSVKVFCSK